MTGYMSFRGNSDWLYQISWTTRKLYDRSHASQWEIQLAMSDFLDYKKTVRKVTCLSVENSAGYVRFPGLQENCKKGHMSFSGKFSWLCQISWTTRKLYDMSHVFQWEIQLAISDSGTIRKLFQREFRWLYHMSLCVINSE